MAVGRRASFVPAPAPDRSAGRRPARRGTREEGGAPNDAGPTPGAAGAPPELKGSFTWVTVRVAEPPHVDETVTDAGFELTPCVKVSACVVVLYDIVPRPTTVSTALA